MPTTIKPATDTNNDVYARNHSMIFSVDYREDIQRFVVRLKIGVHLPLFFARTYYLTAQSAVEAIKYWDRKF